MMKRWISVILFFALFLLPCAGLADAQETYLQAEELLAQSAYGDAAALYDSLSAYQDAPKSAMYARACAALEDGKLEDALSVFTYLGDFRDSDALCYLISVLRMEAAGSYKQAIEACRVLPYSYHGKIREKADELEAKYFPRNYSNASICGDYVIVKHAQSGLYGMIDMDGFVIIPCEWNDISYSEGDSYVCVGLGENYSDRLYGIVSLETGETIIPCQWNMISYSEGNAYARVALGEDYLNRLYGIISLETGETIIPCQWNMISYFEGDTYAIVRSDGSSGSRLYGMISLESGETIIPCQWNEIDYSEGDSYAYVGLGEDYRPLIYGIISLETGEMILPCEYSDVEIAGDYLLLGNEDESGDTYQLIRLSDRKVIIDHAAYIEMSDPEHPYVLGLAPDGMIHIFEGTATQYPPELFEGLEIFESYLAVASAHDDRGYLYLTEDRVIEFTENTIIEHEPEIEQENLDSRYQTDKEITAADIPAKEEKPRTRIIKEGELYGAADAAGNVVVQCEWDHIKMLNESTLLCFSGKVNYGNLKEGNSYLIDLISGTKTAVDWMYTSWYYHEQPPAGLTKVRRTEERSGYTFTYYGIINASGQLVIPCDMKYIEVFEDGYLVIADHDYMYGVYDASLNLIFPHEYSDISYDNGRFSLISGGRAYRGEGEARLTIVDKQGNTIF